MNERRIMKYQMAKLTLQGVISVAVTGIVESLGALFLPKSNKKLRDNMRKVGQYVVSEIISGAIGSVVDSEVDGIKEYYDAKMSEGTEGMSDTDCCKGTKEEEA